MAPIEPITLSGQHIRLEPLAAAHLDGLCEAIRDGELWKIHVTFVPHPDHIDRFFGDAEQMRKEGAGLAFATIDRETDTVIGSTRFMHAQPIHRRIEIGFTFLAASHQRTRANTEAKLLMLTHAFEMLELNRVEFLTDYLNARSRRAILRLGAKEEGMLRSHMVLPDGRVRDSMIYSIIRSEWDGVKRHLHAMLEP